MQGVRILGATGASGAGKTTRMRLVESLGLRGTSFHYFDSAGVPSTAQTIADDGSPLNWDTSALTIDDGVAALHAQIRALPHKP